MNSLPCTVFAGLLDDAAVFPPGNAPLHDAVEGHQTHRDASYGRLVGPLVVPAAALDELAREAAGEPPFAVAVTLPADADKLAAVLEGATRLPFEIIALEIAAPSDLSVAEVVSALEQSLGDTKVNVYVEVPRPSWCSSMLAALAGRYRAKFRTGGMDASMHPSEEELAAAIDAAVTVGVPFKATAGLHHAVRNTDPSTGFEQHGFLNLLLATAVATAGGEPGDICAVLAERDGAALAARLRELGDDAVAARHWFTSFGTCSIADPVWDLAALGLLDCTDVDPA